MVGDKLRFRFEKTGDLRFLSHHDLMRCAERMMRRANIPFKMTAGFHPAPRLVFALSLSLGIIGRNEVVELELTEPRDAEAILEGFRRQAPAGWNFHSVRVVPMKASAVARRIVYQLPLPAHRVESVRSIAESLMVSPEVWVDRYLPRPRQVNIRPYLRGLQIVEGAAQHRFAADVWVTATGTARADELLTLLQIHDLLSTGAILERTDLELVDETPPDATDAPPSGPAITRPLELPMGMVPEGDEPSPTATWGLSPSGPVVE